MNDFTLRTKEGWRRFVESPKTVRPQRLTVTAINRLSPAEHKDYDYRRHRWHANMGIFKTSQLTAAHGVLSELLTGNQHGPGRARTSAVIDGLPAIGKTTAVDSFARSFDRELRARFGDFTDQGHERHPVLRVSLSSQTTLKTLAFRICEFYGQPGYKNLSRDRLVSVATDCIASCGTRLAIIDELHFLDLRKRDGAAVSDFLKELANEWPVTFVHVGVGLRERGFFTEGRSLHQIVYAQNGRRGIRIPLTPMTFDTGESRAEWASLLKAFDRNLVLANHSPGTLPSLSGYFYERTGGHIGSVENLVRLGAVRAILSGSEAITRELLDSMAIDDAAESARIEIAAIVEKTRRSDRARQRRDSRRGTDDADQG